MKEPASILNEINSLYRELFELELETAKISRDDLLKMTDQTDKIEPVEPDALFRREEIMSDIMRLTTDYLQSIMSKT
jgi:hypothetical protein